MAYQHVSYNVVEAVNEALPRTQAFRNHFEALPYESITEALADVDDGPAFPTIKRVIRFVILTATRSK